MSVKEKAPTVAEEMARFSGFTTQNGEPVAPGSENKAGAAVDIAPEEKQAGATLAPGAAANTKTKEPASDDLTDEEAEEALEAAREGLEDGAELSEEEEAAALDAAREAKQKAADKPKNNKDPAQRLRHAQDGRRRAEARAARAEAALLAMERRLAALEGRALTPQPEPAKEAVTDATAPNPKDYEMGEFDPKYIRALVRHEKTVLDAAERKTQQTEQLTAQQREAAAKAAEAREALESNGRNDYDDFDDVVLATVDLPPSDPDFWPLSATMGQLLLSSDVGHHVVYALASNPREARRVARLPVDQQTRWFYRQEAKFEAQASGDSGGNGQGQNTVPQPRRVSSAPPPPSRNRGASGTTAVSAGTSDFAAFEAKVMAELRPRR